MTRGLATLSAAALVLLAAAAAAPAQEEGQEEGAAAPPECSFRASGDELTGRASPPDSASVTLDGGTAKVCYGSPRTRGRDIMGGLVPYDQAWRLGANEPTTLHVTVPVRIGDVEVDAGSYSLYAIPGREEWEIVVNGATDRWGVPIDEEVRAEDIGSVAVEPARTDSLVEDLTLSFRRVEEGVTRMVIEWERTRLEVPVRRAGD